MRRLRAVWPNVRIRVRSDGGFGNPTMYEVSERLEITSIYGLSTNAVLQRASADLLAEAVRRWDETHEPQRLFEGLWYRAGSWPNSRFVVVKAEANAQGTNRRFVVTNRAGAGRYLEATDDKYAMRGESENCNKEFKCGLAMDRLSDHRFVANYFRLYLHGSVEPAGAVAAGDRRSAACPGRRRAHGVVARARTEAIPERAASSGSVGRGATGDVAVIAHQGGGIGDRQLPADRGAAERQLAAPGVLRAGQSTRLSTSDRGLLLDRMKR